MPLFASISVPYSRSRLLPSPKTAVRRRSGLFELASLQFYEARPSERAGSYLSDLAAEAHQFLALLEWLVNGDRVEAAQPILDHLRTAARLSVLQETVARTYILLADAEFRAHDCHGVASLRQGEEALPLLVAADRDEVMALDNDAHDQGRAIGCL